MAALTYVLKSRSWISPGLGYCVLTVALATTGDTVTVTELTTIQDTVAVRLDTGNAVLCSEATNVVTIGATAVASPMLIVVTGW